MKTGESDAEGSGAAMDVGEGGAAMPRISCHRSRVSTISSSVDPKCAWVKWAIRASVGSWCWTRRQVCSVESISRETKIRRDMGRW